MRHVLVAFVLLSQTLADSQAGPPAKLVELDRIVRTVYTTKIWQSDVRQVRLLKLYGPRTETDDAILVELENRVLILAELVRAPADEPTPDELATQRRAWETDLGARSDVDGLLAKAGMSARELQAWHRNDVRIRKYLDQRFGSLPAAQRSSRTQEWIGDLRLRARLKLP